MKRETEKQKQKYIPASIELIPFLTEDIMTISGGYNPAVDLPIDWLNG